MFVGVMNFGQIQKNKVCRCEHFLGHIQLIMFVAVNIVRSYSNQFLVILIRSSKLASKSQRKITFTNRNSIQFYFKISSRGGFLANLGYSK